MMDNFWGRFGGGVFKGYIMRKFNLDEIIYCFIYDVRVVFCLLLFLELFL